MLVLHGGSRQFIANSERSIHDALMVVKCCLKSKEAGAVTSGGAIEMELSKYLREYALLLLLLNFHYSTR